MSEQSNYPNGDKNENDRSGRWSFEDYEAVERSRRKGRWLGVLGALLVVVLVAAVIGLSIFGAYSYINRRPEGEIPAPLGPDAAQQEPLSPQPAPDEATEGSPAPAEEEPPKRSLVILERPEKNEAVLEEGLSTVDIVKMVRPSVVGITVYNSTNTLTPAGSGSGIVMDEQGYIITNCHVVDGAVGINVELDNKDTYSARLIGQDSKTDLAVIKIEAENLAPALFGSSELLQAGERVIAIGSPGGAMLAGSVTQGIVSATDRAIPNGVYSTNFIQTDAAINPGNSGGALINVYGQVIGINSSKIANVNYEGIGFAIPINEAKPVIDDLIAYGRVKNRAKIGITGQAINETVAQLNGIPTGVYIVTVDSDSDLVNYDVIKGDVITHIDGTRIENFSDISRILEAKHPNDPMTLGLYRTARNVPESERSFEVTIRLIEDVG